MGVLKSERERKRRLRSEAKTEYFDAVLRQVKFSWDHEEIENELDEHILEECAYLRARKGLDDVEAETEALKRMGPTEQLGKLLNQAHNPWIGRVWILTTVLVIALLLPLGRVALDELIFSERPWNQDTRTTAEKLEEELGPNGIFYQISCDAVLELDTYEIRFTDVICAYDRTIEDGFRLYLCYKRTGENEAGSYAVQRMGARSFFAPDGELAASLDITYPYEMDRPSLEESFGYSLYTLSEWHENEGYLYLGGFDRSAKYIDVIYNIFGQSDSCRINLTEGLEQAEERLGVKLS